MKKTDKFLSAAVLATAALCASCSTDGLTQQQQGQGETKAVSLTATLDGAQTRTGIKDGSDNTHALYWHDSDQILVRTKNTADNTYSGVQFDIASGTETGVKTATFKGLVGDNAQVDAYALYPYNEKHQFTGESALTYNLPATYTYSTVETGVFPKDGTYRSTSTHVAMLGTIADGTVSFNHLGGLAVIRIDKMPYPTGLITVTADQQLSGDFNVDLSADTPTLAASEGASETDQKVEFNFEGAEEDKAGVFYLPLATGSYSNVKIEVISGLTNNTVEYGNLEVTRASVTAISLCNNDGKIEKEAKKEDGKYTIDGHTFIDLGLPSGLLWAETNIGAEKASDYGNYYAWGETTTKDTYSEASYTYEENATTLDAAHDAATENWGSSCRMPTNDELDELVDNCTWEWTTVDGVNGYKVSSKTEGYTSNSIFLPASGYCDNEGFKGGGAYGYCLSSSLVPEFSNCASALYFYGKTQYSSDILCYFGYAVRPVAAKPTK